MKTVLKLGWILVFSLSTFWVFSKNHPDLKLQSYDGKSFILQITTSEFNNYQITLKDKNDFILMTDLINRKGSVNKKYNLSNLPKGEYFLFLFIMIKELLLGFGKRLNEHTLITT